MTGEYERRLVQIFRETEPWIAQRAAASGSARTGELPDVTLAENSIAFAGELKKTSKNHVSVDPEEWPERDSTTWKPTPTSWRTWPTTLSTWMSSTACARRWMTGANAPTTSATPKRQNRRWPNGSGPGASNRPR